VPPLQKPEQQPLLAVQALPSVLQFGLSAAHLPLVQLPLQHWLFPVHAVPSEPQAGTPHAPLLHTPLQQMPFEAHLLPSETQPPSLPNGEPLLLPVPLLLPAPLLLPVPLLLPAPLLLLDVASPASPTPFALELLLLPQAMNELPDTRPTRTATHTTSALRRRNMHGTVAGAVPAGPSP
jgi:hypothetical protein